MFIACKAQSFSCMASAVFIWGKKEWLQGSRAHSCLPCWSVLAWYSLLCQSYLLPIEHKRCGYCQAPVCIQVSHSSATELNLHLCCVLQSTLNIPLTLSQVEKNNTASVKLSYHFGDVFKLLGTWTERRLWNLQLHHEMVLSLLSKTHMEYTRVRKVCLNWVLAFPA